MEAFKILPREEMFNVIENEDFIRLQDGNELRWISWIPPVSNALIIFVHGYGEYISRYRHWASLFCSNNIGLIGMDFRGHGKSSLKVSSSSYNKYLNDLNQFYRMVKSKYPHTPLFLYGHSMGGNLVLRYLIENNPSVTGIISSSPWIKTYNVTSESLIGIKKLGSIIMPKVSINSGIISHFLSHDKNIIMEHKCDPLILRKIPLRLVSELNESGRIIMRNRHKFNKPVLLMHGTDDRITSYKATADLSNYTSDITTLKLWEGAYHELHNETEKVEIFQFILRWIRQKTTFQNK